MVIPYGILKCCQYFESYSSSLIDLRVYILCSVKPIRLKGYSRCLEFSQIERININVQGYDLTNECSRQPIKCHDRILFRILRYLCYYRQYKGMETIFFICH